VSARRRAAGSGSCRRPDPAARHRRSAAAWRSPQRSAPRHRARRGELRASSTRARVPPRTPGWPRERRRWRTEACWRLCAGRSGGSSGARHRAGADERRRRRKLVCHAGPSPVIAKRDVYALVETPIIASTPARREQGAVLAVREADLAVSSFAMRAAAGSGARCR